MLANPNSDLNKRLKKMKMMFFCLYYMGKSFAMHCA